VVTDAAEVADRLAAGPTAPIPLSEPAWCAVAEAFAARLPLGTVVALHGELGAGKTTFVRACASALGVAEAEVTSPTFAIVHEYAAPDGPVLHADLYRLRHADELDALGWDDLLAGARAAFVEWPERAGDRLPVATWHVVMSHVPQQPAVRTVARYAAERRVPG
jgi:tRNA threonylcarbamoyl adenosine modification protein YjeE